MFRCYTLIMNRKNEAIVSQIMQVINKIIFMEKKNVIEYQGVRLYPSEIHLMLVIDEKHATNATKMARQLGVTKGAVSQTLSRLERKGILTKTKDPYNKNELTLAFTKLGTKVFAYYKTQLTAFLEKHDQYLSTLAGPE